MSTRDRRKRRRSPVGGGAGEARPQERRRFATARAGVLVAGALAAAAVALVVALGRERPGRGEAGAPVASASRNTPATTEYVGREACAECHAEEASRFAGSHHDLAMQEATPETVLGDFGGATLEHGGITSRFSRRDGKYVVATDGPDGAMHEVEVLYTFGVAPLQQYLVATPGGRLHALPLAWDSRPASEGGQRWFHLQPGERIPPEDELHWAQPALAWNDRCARCHSTNLREGWVAADERYETTWSEIDVSCEACHGPGSAHVDLARSGAAADAVRRALPVRLEPHDPARWLFDGESPIARRSVPRASDAELDACAPCHARRTELSGVDEPGAPFLDGYAPSLLDEPLYFADGQIRGEVYEYGSFVQSAMYRAGVTCSDCHEPHGLGLRAEGNALCGQCHRPEVFDVPAHHLHPAGTRGAQCVACHMPSRTYMVVDERRDHGFRVPRPDLAASLGVPDPCTGCHAERTPHWASDAIVAARKASGEAWRQGTPHFAEAIAAGRRGAVDADRRLAEVARDASAPAIVRATAVSLLQPERSDEAREAVRAAASDRDPLLRLGAIEAARTLDPRGLAEIAAPLLSDPVRAVRMAAAPAFAGVDPQLLAPERREARARALAEYRAAQLENGDRAEAHVNLALVAAHAGRPDEAERELLQAIRQSPHFVPASVNLADLLRAQGRDADGERALRRAIELVPDAAAAHHALGLLLVRSRRTAEALEALQRAAELDPGAPRYAYVLGVALHSTGSSAAALEVLRAAHDRHPADADVLIALATISRDTGDRAAALRHARDLVAADPSHPVGRRLVEQLAAAP